MFVGDANAVERSGAGAGIEMSTFFIGVIGVFVLMLCMLRD